MTFKVLASGLQSGDEFSNDDGKTWFRVARTSEIPKNRTLVTARKLRGIGHAADDTSIAQEFYFGEEDEVTIYN